MDNRGNSKSSSSDIWFFSSVNVVPAVIRIFGRNFHVKWITQQTVSRFYRNQMPVVHYVVVVTIVGCVIMTLIIINHDEISRVLSLLLSTAMVLGLHSAFQDIFQEEFRETSNDTD
uniref:Uncharacterized protein n=1 Tax=Glossina palpalis gambiensis TaxID=67801 RepID=A0A1B0AS03_9MUSC